MNYIFVKKFLDAYYFKYNIFHKHDLDDVDIPIELMDNFNEDLKNRPKKCKFQKARFLKDYYKCHGDYKKCKDFITKEYVSGYGIKYIAKHLEISYTQCRNILKYFEVSIRLGMDVVTDKVMLFRKKKAEYERDNNIGWLSEFAIKKRKNSKYNGRGVQGYYFNKGLNKYVWLRSTYEFIFAEWLDYNNKLWDVEVKSYYIDGEMYRPDFFIYNSNMVLNKIVEIKGYWDNRSYKVGLLKKMMPQIEIILLGIDNYSINNYIIEKNEKYGDKLKQWKKIRITKSQKLNL